MSISPAPGTQLLGLGHAAPDRRVTNAELETELGLEPGWIEGRTGIKQRRWATKDEAVSDIAIHAGRMALENSALKRETIGLTILATSTPDHLLPPTAPLLAHRLGLANSGAIDMAGACAGFLYALVFADSFARIHEANVLVVAANILSRRINPTERVSAVLFSDAAGAVLIGPSEQHGTGILGVDLASDGGGYELIRIPAGGSRQPYDASLAAEDLQMTIADGRAVFTKAVNMMAASARTALAQAECNIDGINAWIPHQANARIIDATGTKLGIAPDRILKTYPEYANSSAASIPFTWSFAHAANEKQRGQKILLTAAGAGLTGGAIVYGT